MKKLTKTATILDKLCAVLFWVLALLCGSIVIATAAGAIASRGVLQEAADGNASVTLGMLKLDVANGFISSEIARGEILTGLAVIAVVTVVVCWTLKLFRDILDPMKNGQPFTEETASALHRLGWLTLIGGGAVEILKAAAVFITVSKLDIMQLFNTEAVEHCTVQLDIKLYFVVAAVVYFLLSYIFRYGCELQQQADETL